MSRIKSANGLAKTRINNIYHNMKNRCNNPKNYKYKNYGGRGIKVCNEWQKSFLSFYNWAINNGYDETLTIDRMNVNGNYEPDNCRWIPLEKQFYNRTDNIYYIVNEKKKCLSELCKEYNMPYHTVRKRLERGKDIITALTTPIDIKKRNKLYKRKDDEK